MMGQSTLSFFSLVLLQTILAQAKAQGPPLGSCYYPNGVWAEDQYPCSDHEYISVCCPKGWSCYSNNLCVVTDPGLASSTLPVGSTAQGTCTNPEWSTSDCGNFCLNNPTNSSQGLLLTSCGDDTYCCHGRVGCNCETGQNTFNVAAGSLQTIISNPGASFTATPSIAPSSLTSSSKTTSSSSSTLTTSSTAHTTSSSSTSTSTSSTSSSSSSTTTSITSSTSPSSTTSSSSTLSTTSSSTSTTSSSSSSATSNTPSSSGSQSRSSISSAASSAADASKSALAASQHNVPVTQTTGFKAGIAVAAIVIAAILLGLLLWCCLGRRKRRGSTASATTAPAPPLHSANHAAVTPMSQRPHTPDSRFVSPINSTPNTFPRDYARAGAGNIPGAATRPPPPIYQSMAEHGPVVYPEVVHLANRQHGTPPPTPPVHRHQQDPMRSNFSSPTLRVINATPPPGQGLPPPRGDTVAPLRVYQSPTNSPGMMGRARSSYSPLLNNSSSPESGGQRAASYARPWANVEHRDGRAPGGYYDGSEDFYDER